MSQIWLKILILSPLKVYDICPDRRSGHTHKLSVLAGWLWDCWTFHKGLLSIYIGGDDTAHFISLSVSPLKKSYYTVKWMIYNICLAKLLTTLTVVFDKWLLEGGGGLLTTKPSRPSNAFGYFVLNTYIYVVTELKIWQNLKSC